MLLPILVLCAVLFVPHGTVSPWYFVAILVCPAVMAAMMFSMRDKGSNAAPSSDGSGNAKPDGVR